MADLSDDIETAAGNPASVSGDAGSVTQHNLRDLIEADRYLKSIDQSTNTRRGLVLTKLRPNGSE